MTIHDHWKQLLSIAKSYNSKFRLAFLRAVHSIQDSVKRSKLEAAIDSGNVTLINSSLPWTDMEASLKIEFERLLLNAAVEAGESGAGVIGSKFATDRYAREWATQHAGELVASLTTESRKAIKRTIINGLENGIPTRQQIDSIVSSIGLTERQAQSLENFRQGLISEGMRPGTIDKLVAKKQSVMLRERAAVIAGHEAQIAVNQGFKMAAEQAKNSGELPEDLECTWVVTPDDHLCELCRPLSGIRTPVGKNFSGGLWPPLHIQCRCAVALAKKKE